PQLRVNRVGRRPGTPPAIRQRRADHLPEHLADFRRRREISPRAEWIARRIIICVAGFHERFDRDRPLGSNPLAKRALQWGHLGNRPALTLSLWKGERSHFDKLNVSAFVSRYRFR